MKAIGWDTFIRIVEAENTLIDVVRELETKNGKAKSGCAEIIQRLDDVIGELENIIWDKE